MTRGGWTPCARSNVAQVCLRSWNLSLRMPAFFKAAWKRCVSLGPSSLVPTKAHPRALALTRAGRLVGTSRLVSQWREIRALACTG